MSKRAALKTTAKPRHRRALPVEASDPPPDHEPKYKVGPGRPPKEHQFRPGRSGNPNGSRGKQRSTYLNLKALLERALSKKVTLKQGDRTRIMTLAAAGIEHLVAQYAKGDRHARRDLIMLAERLGVDLATGQGETVAEILGPTQQAILDAYVARVSSTSLRSAAVLAPPQLLDDGGDDQGRT
jgi:hypothetical protein